MKISRGVRELVAEAEQSVVALSPAEVQQRCQKLGVLVVDLRDVRERKRDGKIPESLHVPRGMLEFWIDPDSPYYHSGFDQAEELILYCNKGWRSALAAQTLLEMGITNVAHLAGGLERWQAEGGDVDDVATK